MEQIENKMVVDSHWRDMENHTIEEVLNKSGYHKVGSTEFVFDEEAYDYALDECLHGSEEMQKEFRDMLVDWFYSGGEWRRES